MTGAIISGLVVSCAECPRLRVCAPSCQSTCRSVGVVGSVVGLSVWMATQPVSRCPSGRGEAALPSLSLGKSSRVVVICVGVR